MRQVPNKITEYLLIGSGRLAKHLRHYFQLKQITLSYWSRQAHPDFDSLAHHPFDVNQKLDALLTSPKKVLLAINDDQIEPFVKGHPQLKNSICIHFSGARSQSIIQNVPVFAAHPLMTFAEPLYSLEKYEQVPFITEEDAPSFSELFPEFINPSQSLPQHQKTLYHCLCVSSGNFTNLLWNYISTLFEKDLHLPKELLWPYLRQTCENIEHHGESSLTGPMVRNDQQTIQRHLEALQGDPLENLYYDFVQLYQITKKQKEASL